MSHEQKILPLPSRGPVSFPTPPTQHLAERGPLRFKSCVEPPCGTCVLSTVQGCVLYSPQHL